MRLTRKNTSIVSAKRVPALKSKTTRRIINRFHLLNKRLQTATCEVDRIEIRQEIDRLGGLDFYQQCSLLGQSPDRGGDTSHVLIKYLIENNMNKNELRLLDVGALRPNYQRWSWIDSTSIDLNSQSEHVEKIDFMEMNVPKNPFDVISLSLVLNFVPTPSQRGQMLMRAEKFLKPSTGLLFVVLPRPCIKNSRYLSHKHFCDLMKSLGFDLLFYSETNKLSYFIFLNKQQPMAPVAFPKQKVNDGPNRNNFCIVIE